MSDLMIIETFKVQGKKEPSVPGDFNAEIKDGVFFISQDVLDHMAKGGAEAWVMKSGSAILSWITMTPSFFTNKKFGWGWSIEKVREATSKLFKVIEPYASEKYCRYFEDSRIRAGVSTFCPFKFIKIGQRIDIIKKRKPN